MTTYKHVQEVKKAKRLPDHDKVGPCLTCRSWQVTEARGRALVTRLALCVHPALKPHALIVSGSSGCNKWQEKRGIAPGAKAYAKEGEDN